MTLPVLLLELTLLLGAHQLLALPVPTEMMSDPVGEVKFMNLLARVDLLEAALPPAAVAGCWWGTRGTVNHLPLVGGPYDKDCVPLLRIGNNRPAARSAEVVGPPNALQTLQDRFPGLRLPSSPHGANPAAKPAAGLPRDREAASIHAGAH